MILKSSIFGLWWYKNLDDWNGFISTEAVRVNLMSAKNYNSTRNILTLLNIHISMYTVQCCQDHSWAYEGATTTTYQVRTIITKLGLQCQTPLRYYP